MKHFYDILKKIYNYPKERKKKEKKNSTLNLGCGMIFQLEVCPLNRME